MARFTAALFASLVALSSVSAAPAPALGADELLNFAAGDSTAILNARDSLSSDILDRAMLKRSSSHSGSATYTGEGLVSHAALF